MDQVKIVSILIKRPGTVSLESITLFIYLDRTIRTLFMSSCSMARRCIVPIVLLLHLSITPTCSFKPFVPVAEPSSINRRIKQKQQLHVNHGKDKEWLLAVDDHASCLTSEKSTLFDPVVKRRGGGKHIHRRFLTAANLKRISVCTMIVGVCYLLYSNLNQFLPTKEEIQSFLLDTISNIREKHGNRALLYYISSLALWECMGISSIIIEPIGGMVWGLRIGLGANLIGKVSGAMISYALGRTLFEDRVRSYLQSKQRNDDGDDKLSDILPVVIRSISKRPFSSSLIMKFSIFPELVKNLTLSAIENVKWWIFFLVSLLHFTPYSFLWTALGHDSALRLENIDMPPNNVLKGCMLFSFVLGGVTPPLFLLWVRHQVKHANDKKQD